MTTQSGTGHSGQPLSKWSVRTGSFEKGRRIYSGDSSRRINEKGNVTEGSRGILSTSMATTGIGRSG
jgi:hypothetical protein